MYLFIIESFLTYVNMFPEWLVFDIGGQVGNEKFFCNFKICNLKIVFHPNSKGQFTLFSAKMNRAVVLVEPFYDNILRIHKAAKLANLEKKITLIKNVLSDQRNRIIRLNPVSVGDHVGDHYFQFDEDPTDKYNVETVFFDDIISYLPRKEDGEKFQNAIMKIDIEGFGPTAFRNASKLFSKIQVNIIFMEWMNLPKKTDTYKAIDDMIEFLLEYQMIPYSNSQKLDCTKWKDWPSDIIWKKEGF